MTLLNPAMLSANSSTSNHVSAEKKVNFVLVLATGNFDRESLRKNVFAGRWFLQMISEASGMNYH